MHFVESPQLLRKSARFLGLMGLFLTLLISLAEASGPAKGKGGAAGGPPPHTATGKASGGKASAGSSGSLSALASNYITYQERRILSDYFAKHRTSQTGLPPGLAKRGTLPRGLARQLARNGKLPPGLELQPLPDDIMRILPVRDPRYSYRYIDGRILLIETTSNLILDILSFLDW